MRTTTIITLTTLTCWTAWAAAAAPPSSTLGGDDGTLTWSVTAAGDQITIEGRSPKWTVTHLATRDLEPISTTRTDAEGTTVTIEYRSDGVTVTLPNKTVTHDEAGIWDGDTLDVRLGHQVAIGQPAVEFRVVDTSSGKVYSFVSVDEGDKTCGGRSCKHVKVHLTGLLKAVGPKWHYWFADDGQLLRFEGPAGTFVAGE